jgi:hypothetical protein
MALSESMCDINISVIYCISSTHKKFDILTGDINTIVKCTINNEFTKWNDRFDTL